VATGSYDNTTKIWNVSTPCWSLIRTYTGHTKTINGLEFINEDTIATGSSDNLIQIWSISSGNNIRTINAFSVVYSLQLLNKEFYLAAGLNNNKLSIFNINNGSLITTLVGHIAAIFGLELLSSDLLASSGDTPDNTVRIWNLTTNTLKFNLTGHTLSVRGLKLISFDVMVSGS
jgi:WD40 repeat protein